MERIPKGLYTPEFRVEAVKLVEEKGLSVDAAAKRLADSAALFQAIGGSYDGLKVKPY